MAGVGGGEGRAGPPATVTTSTLMTTSVTVMTHAMMMTGGELAAGAAAPGGGTAARVRVCVWGVGWGLSMPIGWGVSLVCRCESAWKRWHGGGIMWKRCVCFGVGMLCVKRCIIELQGLPPLTSPASCQMRTTQTTTTRGRMPPAPTSQAAGAAPAGG